MQGGDSYSVDEAARILQLTPGRIRQMLLAGELEGVPPEESGGTEVTPRAWDLPKYRQIPRPR